MKWKEGDRLTRRLILTLIVCGLVMIALAVLGGVALSGVLWYQDQVTALQEENKKAAALLQSQVDELESQLKQAQEEARRADGLESQAGELQSRADELQRQLDEANQALSEAKQQLAALTAVQYPEGTKLVALTFDDGPGKNTTPRLLDELKKRNVRATFFVVGTNAAKYPDLLKRMDAEGHVIGTHTYAHKNLTKVTEEQLHSEVEKCSAIIEQAVGHGPALLRPPGGNYDNRLLAYCKELGLPLANWSVDTRDWESRNKEAILAAAFQKGSYGVRDGAIILLHDVYESSVDAAIEMVDRLLADGYTLVTVPELLRVRAGGAQAGRMYYSDTRYKDSV